MKNNKTLRKLVTLTGIAYLSFAAVFSPVCTLTANAAVKTEEGISPQSDVLRWYFKEENGKLYKRLFNTTKGVWVGNWIYVGDL